jgi:hypothetical protein
MTSRPGLGAVVLTAILSGCRGSEVTRADKVAAMLCTTEYRSTLGFALMYPCDWEVSDLTHGPCASDSSRLCDAVQIRTSDTYGNHYGVDVFRYFPSVGDSITDTVEFRFDNLAPSARDQIATRCCTVLGSEPAMELTVPFPDSRYGSRELSAVHSGAEYSLTFWWNVPFQPGSLSRLPAGSAPEAAFDAILRTFTFLPMPETPVPPSPVATPAPTPTRTQTPTSTLTPVSSIGSLL